MSENSLEIPEKLTGNTGTILTGSGISYAQIPRNLFKLADYEGITYSDLFLSLRLFDYCHSKRKFPHFQLSHSEIAKMTTMSRRQVMYGLERLIDLRVLSVRPDTCKAMVYQWNEYFLQTGELPSANFAQVGVQSLHRTCASSAQEGVQSLHHIYIEFILDYIYILYRAYFESSESLIKRVPPKRGQKGVAKDFATHYYVSRKDAWREAIEHVQPKSGWIRIYVALAGGFNIDEVNYPKAYLSKLVWDESHQWESKKKSYLQTEGHLEDDASFLKFIMARRNQ